VTDIWLPGLGNVPFNVVNASNAVNDYDPELMLGRNNQTGTWHVLVKNGPHDGQPFPVFSIGAELPPYDQLQKMLYQHDVRRHGAKIVDAIERKKRIAKKHLDDEALDRAGEVAEYIEWGHRVMGSHPSPRVFVPSSPSGKEG
jgi:hypothetical protein